MTGAHGDLDIRWGHASAAIRLFPLRVPEAPLSITLASNAIVAAFVGAVPAALLQAIGLTAAAGSVVIVAVTTMVAVLGSIGARIRRHASVLDVEIAPGRLVLAHALGPIPLVRTGIDLTELQAIRLDPPDTLVLVPWSGQPTREPMPALAAAHRARIVDLLDRARTDGARFWSDLSARDADRAALDRLTDSS